MELTVEQVIAGLVVALGLVSTVVRVLWTAREDDSKELREVTGRVGRLEGRHEAIEELSSRVIDEIKTLKDDG